MSTKQISDHRSRLLNGPIRPSVALHLQLALQVSSDSHVHVTMTDYGAEPHHMQKQLVLLYFAAQYKFACFFCMIRSKQTQKSSRSPAEIRLYYGTIPSISKTQLMKSSIYVKHKPFKGKVVLSDCSHDVDISHWGEGVQQTFTAGFVILQSSKIPPTWSENYSYI